MSDPYGEEQEPPTTGTTNSEKSNSNTQQAAGQSSPDTQHDEQSEPNYAIWIVVLAIVCTLLAFGITMWLFSGVFEDPAFVTTALSTLIAIYGILVVAYLGINATNSVAQRQIGAANSLAQRQIKEANNKAEQWEDFADKALAALSKLSPEEAERIRGQKPRG